MLKDKSILESFDLVEELDDESAASYSGGELTGNWILTTIGGETVISEREITASFIDGRVSGQAFCNLYFAPYETKGEVGGVGALKVGLMGTTLRACQEPLMKQDFEYFNALGEVSSYAVTNEFLILYGGKETLVFEPHA